MKCVIWHGSAVAVTVFGIWLGFSPQAHAGPLVIAAGTDLFTTPFRHSQPPDPVPVPWDNPSDRGDVRRRLTFLL